MNDEIGSARMAAVGAQQFEEDSVTESRSRKLTAAQRTDSAKKAARARWKRAKGVE